MQLVYFIFILFYFLLFFLYFLFSYLNLLRIVLHIMITVITNCDKDIITVVMGIRTLTIFLFLFFYFLFFYFFWFYFSFSLLYFPGKTTKKAHDKEVTWQATWCDVTSLEHGEIVWKMTSGHMEYTWWPWVRSEANMRMEHGL